ncbi:hypothetical protein GCM10010978_05630 [Compostibacillus humi]|uniref:Glycosyltransferase n=1 Tax=Compostibacillus humi TaxID=1245525 RepID=A0A8J2ZR33_9BACI|nr:glycosyltransferase [Compostibacillus humi]GGH70577.1 hypothetical protein GCM10010978_05630 [Compostibacillus humi]
MSTVIILSGVSYDGFKQRPQHFADYFSKIGNEVLYIGLLEHNRISKMELDKVFDKKSLLNNLFQINAQGVYILNNEIKNLESDFNMSDLVKKINEVYRHEKITYLVCYPEWIKYFDDVPSNCKIIYDCIDDWESFLNDAKLNISKNIAYYERKIANISNLVLASARRLYAKMSYYNKNVYYLPNGVWNKDYLNTVKESSETPVDLISMKKPIVFFMGAIAEWVDINLIDYLAKSRPEYSFVFVGTKRVKVPDYCNVFFLGSKDYSLLPSYLTKSNVAIIPFKVNNLTASVTPLKLYEYLSSGTPVVSTVMPDIIGLPGLRVAENYQQFLEYIDYYVSLNKKEYEIESQKAINTAKNFDWNKLLEPISNYIESGNLNLESNEAFLQKAIDNYKSLESSPLIKNELLGFYCVLEKYMDALELFNDFNDNELKKIDCEKLALASAMLGDFSKAVELLKKYFYKNDYNLYTTYLDSLLKEDNKEELLKIFLLKLSGNTYGALNIADSLIKNSNPPKLLGLLAGLYLDIGEYEISFQIAVDIIAKERKYNIEELFDYKMIEHIVYSLTKFQQFDIAEEIALSLMKNNKEWEEKATQLLSDVYIDKHMK